MNPRFNDTSTIHKPLAIFIPQFDSHVQAAVLCCRKHELRLRIRSGGHDFEGLSYLSVSPSNDDFVMIDLTKLRAGATLGELYYAISQKSRYFLGSESVETLLRRTGEPARKVKSKSDFVQEPLPEDAVDGIWRILAEVGPEEGVLQLEAHGGKMSEVPEFSIPYPHRAGNVYMIQYYAYWDGNGVETEERHLDWIRRLEGYLAPFVSQGPRGAYVNARDLDLGMNGDAAAGRAWSCEQGSDWGRRYYKGNFERLVRVKTDVDPANFFRNEQSIPPFFLGSRHVGE
ncbi:unnamed protein product [Linum tenue]|uniref:Berberine/berberine-like domain-containing protein n=1 Tax=Linum tenue TaxID=586396 RepID=A0AAV0QNK8_9ROSI|nr:unnamed protein product [Linum tenue]